ncbi:MULTISPECIES: aromatic ring-hydroxylating dioxygenase subunit alpha [unclassified Saccharopolyspora]|uniref:aromatic ring-hydroxylating oxygenase subunit alpha n=1 Tax=unclassified Saccharopolyspora TaxID=2646250 RepID=UPI001CD3FE27|nr:MULTISPECIES: ring-hydroxylating oxygenase subunit alpha [unclassified Saccharopolyspora]MCA1185052.1 ring-hydroxylating oxygenase subunit alpha [Saccharopolyspora sp. 6T]MCA1190767.1 ring-hydroxylating oxygenase subunit alpha [Saccharopolyspora sp. 6V]MCA1226264.1 ring-hydroxylating oxygenase subunit alpha [Saccharopolyspora sp. 6M]MCA1278231.1 ring-hydroxylating oxygenase subunit alpha [Saccharopolyspora sp. 7B]
MTTLTTDELKSVSQGYDADPGRSMSLRAEAYTDPKWHRADLEAIFSRTWQWVCHVEQLAEPGGYVATTVAERPIVVVRDRQRRLRAFYNVCKHRAHELVSGSGTARTLVCPYHAWTYDLTGALVGARQTDRMAFDKSEICLDQVQVEEFCGFVYVNLDPSAAPLAEQAPDLAAQITERAPDIAGLTHAKRLHYDVKTNWKNVIDNFLECYHCHVAHKEFVSLVDMDTYDVKTHGIWSSHFADAGKSANTAYDVSGATVTEHAVWWLWPNTCLLRYPGRGNFMVFQILPAGPDRSLETWDFYLESTELTEVEQQSVDYIDDVLQVQDIDLVESVQRGMESPAFDQGRIVYDPERQPGLSEHGVHHFHGLVLEAYAAMAANRPTS